ncbi:unnamed protein product [Cuscuta campestris]|uniref:Uncharacterized protein n=1 Tax=Cuscuta campestris TaxID=132261 RepID=A0A484MG44_9ASTE|nr:unnamed protein product [Cuscuta campestris]
MISHIDEGIRDNLMIAAADRSRNRGRCRPISGDRQPAASSLAPQNRRCGRCAVASAVQDRRSPFLFFCRGGNWQPHCKCPKTLAALEFLSRQMPLLCCCIHEILRILSVPISDLVLLLSIGS